MNKGYELIMARNRCIGTKLKYLEMEDNDSDASDAEAPGPGVSVADISALDRRVNVDEPGTSTDNDLVQQLDMPLDGSIICAQCAQIGRDKRFLNEQDFIVHVQKQHANVTARWKCRQCGKIFERLHGWRCHFPKCRGERIVAQKEYTCNECNESFDTSRGLSMHERHRHPVVRNTRRRQALETVEEVRTGRATVLWSEEETTLLRQLNEQFKGETYINVKIKEYLQNKTFKQISDKRRRLGLIQGAIEVEAPQELNAEAAFELATEKENASNNIEDRTIINGEWQQTLKKAIQGIVLERGNELEEVSERINELTITDCESTEIDILINNLTEKLLANDSEGENRRNNSNNNNRGGHNVRGKKQSNRSRRESFKYSRYQDMYNKCPKRLIDMAITGKLVEAKERIQLPKKEEVEELYKNLWGIAGPKEGLPRLEGNKQNNVIPIEQLYTPITADDIIVRMKKVKTNSAAGVDGLRKIHVRAKGAIQIMAKLYNLLLLKNYYPKAWKVNRTTLIPKQGKDIGDVKNWRPITIGSFLGRMFSAMIDIRLRRKIEQTIRQKGFTKEDGCKQNVALLSSSIARMKERHGGVVTVVDISKAFDTIPHAVIGDCLEQKGIPLTIAEYIASMYSECSTKIKTGSDEVGITLERGVKQGDPLSPLLFNLTMDPIIHYINEKTEGIEIGTEKVAILAFADDMVLLAENKKEAQKQVQLLYTYLRKLGMEIAANKCCAFQIVSKSKTWYLTDPGIIVGEEVIPESKPDEIITYLGIELDAWKGLRTQRVDKIVQAVKTVQKMGLKPHQKINLIRTYLLPKFIHKLVGSPPPLKTLETLDHEIKQVIKRILRLHPSTTDGVIYSDKSHGGIGMTRMANIVKLAVIRNGIKMKESEDEAVRNASTDQETMIVRYADSIGLEWPTTMENVESKRREMKRGETERWEQLISQGQGVADFRKDKIGNSWLYNPKLLKPSRYLDALKLRTNTFGTKVALRRANKDIDALCRRCKAQIETLGHILGNCTHTKPSRIRRHDEIKELVENKVSQRCTVFAEPTVNVLGEMKKPDLVIKDQDKLIIVDVTVRYEDKNNLRNAFTDKTRKYKETAEFIRIKTGCSKAEILPIVVGCRGAIPKETQRNSKILGLSKQDMITMSMIALRSSLEMANAFLDYERIR